MKFKLTPIQECAFFLAILALTAVLSNLGGERLLTLLVHLLTTLGVSLMCFFIFKKFLNQPHNILDTVITGLILFLVLHYPNRGFGQDLLYGVMASVIAIGSKFLLHFKGMPILNPAATGLVGTLLLSKLFFESEAFVSWWGTDFRGYLSLSLLLLWILIGLRKWRKYSLLIAFLSAHMLLLLARGEGTDFIQYTFTHSTIFFLGSIMLVEPKTSPLLPKQQIAYGILAALVWNLWLHLGFSYGELFAILIANLFNLGLKTKTGILTPS